MGNRKMTSAEYCWAPYLPGLGGGGYPPGEKIEDYTSPFEQALTPPDLIPAPDPEIRYIRVTDNSAQQRLNDIRDSRFEADWTRRRDNHRRDMMERGYCSRHMLRNCRHEDCRD